MTLTFKKLRDGAIIPERKTDLSAGLDLHACIDAPTTINPGEIVSFPIGIAVCPDRDDVVMLIFMRSGLGSRHGLSLPNSVGVVDSDYRGELSVPLINLGKEPYTVVPGERIAQLVTLPVLFPDTAEADSLPETERGTNGFGSTGRL